MASAFRILKRPVSMLCMVGAQRFNVCVSNVQSFRDHVNFTCFQVQEVALQMQSTWMRHGFPGRTEFRAAAVASANGYF